MREQKLLQNRKDKAARLREAQVGAAELRAQRASGIDPDIAGITPGPQKSPWADFAPPLDDDAAGPDEASEADDDGEK